jgi:signal transduction histidine kinase
VTDGAQPAGEPGDGPPDRSSGPRPAGPWERRDYWRRQQRDLRRRRHLDQRRRWRHGTDGAPDDGRPPWGDGPRPGPGWILRRVVPIVIGLVLVVAFTTAVFAWVVASVFGFLGPDPVGGGPLVVLLRIAGVGLVVLGVASIVRRVRRLGEPIAELADATSRIEAGDYSVRVDEPDRGAPELLELARGFNTMAARLEGDERQRRSLLADVSHELRTPLAVVQGNVEALVDGVHPADPEHLAAILEETRVLGRLIDDLRTVALSEAGTLPLHREPTDLGLLIADVARSFRPVAEASGTTIALDVPSGTADDLPLADVDPIRVREVLSNLVANALRYSPPGAPVTIGLAGEGSGRWARIEVRDRGPGLPPEVAERVFDRFARSADSGGSGLGLAIAKYLVEAHGGEIGLLSDPGTGTTAWFRLPLPTG